MIARGERLHANVAQAEADRELKGARRDVRIAEIALANILAVDGPVTLTSPLFLARIDEPLPEFIRSAIDRHPGLKQVAAKKDQAHQGYRAEVGRVVYISEDARAALQAWMRVRDSEKSSLFYAQGRRSMGYAAARTRFVKYLVKAGLDRKGYTLHCLRHTFASEMLNAGMRLECLQQLLGHSSIEVTRR